MEWPLILILVGFLAFALWYVRRGQYVFVVRVADGRPHVVRGKVTQAFLQEVGEVLSEHGVSHGDVCGFVRGRSIALAFSGSIPPPCRQRLRNIWAMCGWPAKPGHA